MIETIMVARSRQRHGQGKGTVKAKAARLRQHHDRDDHGGTVKIKAAK